MSIYAEVRILIVVTVLAAGVLLMQVSYNERILRLESKQRVCVVNRLEME